MNFRFPASVLATHTAVLGKTGSGKTSTGKLLVEQVAEEGARACVLDCVKSDWWGLISSADGKRPGLPFHILGGPHGHVPLHAGAGRAIGELVGTGALPLAIIDMADFEAGGIQKFFIDFAPALLRKMRGVLYLVIEEAHELAPKERAGITGENMAVHYAKKLATAGRSKGVRLIVLTQRTQALHNAVLGSCETLIAHRLTAPADQKPVVDWLRANADKSIADNVSRQLAGLRTGSAWLVSGEAQLAEQISFPRIKTFDNSATPEADDQEHHVARAPVDTEKLRAVIGEAVKEAEQNDPKRLKARIAELERAARTAVARPDEIHQRPGITASSGITAKDIDDARARGHAEGFNAGVLKMRIAMRNAADRLSGHAAEASKLGTAIATVQMQLITDSEPDVRAAQNRKEPVSPGADHQRARQHEANARASRQTNAATSGLPKAERQLLIVLAQRHPKPCSRAQLSVLSGYSLTSSSFTNALGALRSNGYAVGFGDDNRVTEAGLRALGAYEPLPTGAMLITWWLGRLPKAERTLLEYICGRYPEAVSKQELSGETGYSITSSSFTNALGKLRTLELIERGEIRASSELFA